MCQAWCQPDPSDGDRDRWPWSHHWAWPREVPRRRCVCGWSRDQSDQLRQEAGGFRKGGLQGEKSNWFCINAFEHLGNNMVGTWWREWHTWKKTKMWAHRKQASEQSETVSSRKNKQLYEKGNTIHLGSATRSTVVIRRKKCEYQARGMGGEKNVRKSNRHFHLSCVRKSKDDV